MRVMWGLGLADHQQAKVVAGILVGGLGEDQVDPQSLLEEAMEVVGDQVEVK